MNTILSAITAMTFAATTVVADTNIIQNISGNAAKIQRDATAISGQLKAKNPDFEAVKAKSNDLNKDIQSLREEVASFEASGLSLSDQQKKNWELVKTKAELLLIFSDKKNSLLNEGDFKKNRSLLRAYSDGIAKRAEMLQETTKKLNR